MPSKKARYAATRPPDRLIEGLASRLFRMIYHFLNRNVWGIYRIVMAIEWWFYRAINHIQVRGRENIPKNGAFLIMNHIGSKDVEIIMSMFKRPLSVFTDIGEGWFADMMENVFSFVPRAGISEVMIEKMIRVLLTKNRYLAMWPEGSPSHQFLPNRNDPAVMEGFSGIIKVYAAVNAKRD